MHIFAYAQNNSGIISTTSIFGAAQRGRGGQQAGRPCGKPEQRKTAQPLNFILAPGFFITALCGLPGAGQEKDR